MKSFKHYAEQFCSKSLNKTIAKSMQCDTSETWGRTTQSVAYQECNICIFALLYFIVHCVLIVSETVVLCKT